MKRIISLVLVIGALLSVSSVAFAADWDWPGQFPQTSQGASGNYVRAIQNMCKYNAGVSITVDGVFGSGTRSAVKAFQNRHNLPDDGIVGYDTWAKMQSQITPRVNATLTGEYKIMLDSGQYSNTSFYSWKAVDLWQWKTYVAAPGSAPGTWYPLG